MLRRFSLICLLSCGCLADHPQLVPDDDSVVEPARRVTHLVDPGSTTWTEHGHMAAMAYLPADVDRTGRVFCDVHDIDEDGLVQERRRTTMTGEVRDGWLQQGPRELVWAVPLMLDGGHVQRAGQHYARCAVDGAPGATALREMFVLRPPKLPDLALSERVDVFDCATQGPPQQGAPACVRVEHRVPQAIVSPQTTGLEIDVACTFDGPSEVAELRVVGGLAELETVDMGQSNLAVGTYDLRCTTDARNLLEESDEANNHAGASVAVFPPIDLAVFRLQVREIELAKRPPPQTAPRFSGFENGPRPEPIPTDTLNVIVDNVAPHAIRAIRVSCDVDGETYSTDLQSAAIEPGELTVRVVIPEQPSGSLSTRCVAELISPSVGAPPAALARSLRVP